MRAVDRLGEFDGRDLRVDRGAVETRVAEELLDVADQEEGMQKNRPH